MHVVVCVFCYNMSLKTNSQKNLIKLNLYTVLMCHLSSAFRRTSLVRRRILRMVNFMSLLLCALNSDPERPSTIWHWLDCRKLRVCSGHNGHNALCSEPFTQGHKKTFLLALLRKTVWVVREDINPPFRTQVHCVGS